MGVRVDCLKPPGVCRRWHERTKKVRRPQRTSASAIYPRLAPDPFRLHRALPSPSRSMMRIYNRAAEQPQQRRAEWGETRREPNAGFRRGRPASPGQSSINTSNEARATCHLSRPTQQPHRGSGRAQ
eukprot:366418-Chlamydomonas_euryale.AAC.5